MKQNKWVLGLAGCSAGIVLTLATVCPAGAAETTREKLLMDFGWKFHLGNEWGTTWQT
jgi:hypothetical protein